MKRRVAWELIAVFAVAVLFWVLVFAAISAFTSWSVF